MYKLYVPVPKTKKTWKFLADRVTDKGRSARGQQGDLCHAIRVSHGQVVTRTAVPFIHAYHASQDSDCCAMSLLQVDLFQWTESGTSLEPQDIDQSGNDRHASRMQDRLFHLGRPELLGRRADWTWGLWTSQPCIDLSGVLLRLNRATTSIHPMISTRTDWVDLLSQVSCSHPLLRRFRCQLSDSAVNWWYTFIYVQYDQYMYIYFRICTYTFNIHTWRMIRLCTYT